MGVFGRFNMNYYPQILKLDLSQKTMDLTQCLDTNVITQGM
jgi:hypothetical protein